MILEAQLGYVSTAVRRIRELGWSSITVRSDVQRRYDNEVQGALTGTVYNTGGCSSYYLDTNGRNSFSWPWSTGRMRSRLATFDPADYIVRSPADRPAEMT